jgi:hypothetical protein
MSRELELACAAPAPSSILQEPGVGTLLARSAHVCFFFVVSDMRAKKSKKHETETSFHCQATWSGLRNFFQSYVICLGGVPNGSPNPLLLLVINDKSTKVDEKETPNPWDR